MGTPPSILPTSVSSISSLTYAAIETPRPVRIEIVPSRVALGILSDFSPFWSHDHVDQRDSPAFESLIQNAIHGRNGLYWLIDGCRVDGRSDCPRICEDRGLLFGSPENFYNCVALASLSYWTQHTRRFYIPREMDGAMSTIMGSTSLASFDRRSVLQSFVTCAQDACGADGLHKPCDDSVRKLSLDASDRAIFEAMDKFCLDLEAEINPDIFGPGVGYPPLHMAGGVTECSRFSFLMCCKCHSRHFSTCLQRASRCGCGSRRRRDRGSRSNVPPR